MALPAQLFWWDWFRKAVLGPFFWVVLFLFILWVPFLRVWWWIFLPLILQAELKKVYIWWLNWDYNYANIQWVVLELIPPKETEVPLKAMEDIFSVTWPLWDNGNFRERWVDGTMANSPNWCSWEIASTEGKIHFYVRTQAAHVGAFETAIFAHYPDVEIHRVPDYVNAVPPTIPNDEWDMYGEDWDLKKEDAYPIRTYENFFEPQGEKMASEEKRLDPIISLLESMTRLGTGEHYWVQFITVPIADVDEPAWKKEGERVISKIVKREIKKKQSLLDHIFEIMWQVVRGPEKEGSGESAKHYWIKPEKGDSTEREMVLTPGEREIVAAVENKMKKPVFKTTIRGVYVAKRENWSSANKTLMRSYMAHFLNSSLNYLTLQGKTRPKVHYFWRKRRTFIRARKMFRNTILRFPPLFPDRSNDDLNPILNTEELATLYHFPVRLSGMVSPNTGKVESKKAGPPPNLPVE